ncbi:MAG: hypothetical protein WA814_10415 [Candidatus Baltobacteraceae bacterium]
MLQKIAGAARATGSLCAASIALAACSASQPQTGLPAATALQGSARQTTSGDLLYAGAKHDVVVYSYPDGGSAGSFKTPGLIRGMCSDAGGDVFIAAFKEKGGAFTGFVSEYAHGGTAPIATLALPQGKTPIACSSDPTSGDLAVTVENPSNHASSVAIYAGAAGTPAILKNRNIGALPQLGYDASGNLFVTSGSNAGAILAKGSNAFTAVTFGELLGVVGHVQWDGTAFALQTFAARRTGRERVQERIFRLTISGSTGTIVGQSHLLGWRVRDGGQSWIEGDTLLATPDNRILFWPYPQGGEPSKALHPATPTQAITVSAGASR